MRLALDAKKRKKPDTKPGHETHSSTPELSLERRRLGEAIAEAAAALPEDQRAVLVLSDMHGLSIAEIAEAVDAPENTVKTRLFRAREKMRAALIHWRKP